MIRDDAEGLDQQDREGMAQLRGEADVDNAAKFGVTVRQMRSDEEEAWEWACE